MSVSIQRSFEGKFPRYIITNSDSDLSVDISDYISTDNILSDSTLDGLATFYASLLDDAQRYLDIEELLASYCTKTDPMDFYRSLFPVGSFERSGHYEDEKPNGLAMIVNRENKARTIVVNDELEALERLQGTRFAFMSPIGYIGRSRKAENARQIYAMTFDLDGITHETLTNILKFWQGESDLAPKATWIIHSGYGLHLYYQFKEPVPAYPNIQNALKELKMRLLPLIWNKYTSTDKNPQKQGIMQGFRVVGSGSKLGVEYPVTAYKFGDPVSIDYLISYIGTPKERESCAQLFEPLQKGELSLDKAKELYPDWYARKIEGIGLRQTWHIKRDLYDWWLRTLRESSEVVAGHRYFCLMCLAIYARKCDVSEEELTNDALSLVPYLDSKKRDSLDGFSEDDAMAALVAYADSYATFPRKDMESLSGVSMPPNKRNHRKQKVHLKIARSALQIMNDADGVVLQGRPRGTTKTNTPKGDLIREYAAEHPDASHSAIAKALGVSRPTVIKWLKDWKPVSES